MYYQRFVYLTNHFCSHSTLFLILFVKSFHGQFDRRALSRKGIPTDILKLVDVGDILFSYLERYVCDTLQGYIRLSIPGDKGLTVKR